MKEKSKIKLREEAESILVKTRDSKNDYSIKDYEKLIHDLNVHQIELEIQNEELQRIQRQLEESSSRYASLFNQAPVGYLMIDKNSIILQANQTFADMTGKEIRDLTGKPFSDHLAEPDKKIFHARFKAFFKSPEGKSINLNIVGKDKFLIPVNLSGRIELPPSDQEASLNRKLLMVVSDISDQKKAEDELLRKASEFESLIKSMVSAFAIHRSVFDEDGRLINSVVEYINDRYEEMLDVKASSVIGKTLLDIFPGTEPKWLENMDEVARTGIERDFEMYHHPTKKTYHCKVYRPWTTTERFCVLFEDITAEKLAQEELKDKQMVIQFILEQTLSGYWDWNLATGVEYYSPTYKKMFGYEDHELENRQESWQKLILPEDLPGVLKVIDKHIKSQGKEPLRIELRFRHKNGSIVWVISSGKVIEWDKNGKALRMVGCHIDITKLKKTELALRDNEQNLKIQNERYIKINEKYQFINRELSESNSRIIQMNSELLRAKERAEESDRLKSAFLANMSHEIRTPMNGLLGFSKMLTDSDLSKEDKKHYSEIINNSGQQLLSIINDIIDISRIETNQVKVFESAINLKYFFQRVFEFFNPQAISKNINLRMNIEKNLELMTFISDETKLNQIFSNLIGNALKFTEQGYIEFGARRRDSYVEFYIKDTGIGIRNESKKIIFERFRQLETNENSNQAGTGLGLSISKAFVELLGGKIWVESSPGEGSTFFFNIPFDRNKRSIKLKRAGFQGEKTNLSNYLIMIAEDEDINYMYLDEILKKTGAQVVRARNGREAVEIVREFDKIDLVLMDIKMPEMDGIEATRIIKSLRGELPVIATTAYALGGDREKFLEAGCDDYLSKPVVKKELLSKISKLV